MTLFKCKICGGALEVAEGARIVTCEYCGTKQTLPKLDDERRANLYDRAGHFRRNSDFDRAAGIYNQILNEDSSDAEAYWSLVLCRYGVEYVKDPATGKHVPTVNRAQYTSIFDDEDYKAAIANADGYQRELYEAEASVINDIQKGILAISQKEEPFDVFICYKESDKNGRRTEDSVLAAELYRELTREGFRVFYARVTLEDKLGAAYEPYIFAALHSAKVMVVLGTDPANFNAVWVKNEWSRYLALIKNGARKLLIPAYRGMDPYDLPEEFSHLQAQDMSRLGFMQDLVHAIGKAVEGKKAPTASAAPAPTSVTDKAPVQPSTELILKRIRLFLEDGKPDAANDYCERLLDGDPENAEVYLAKLMIDMNAADEKALVQCGVDFSKNPNYQKALRFASPALAEKLKDYVSLTKYNAAVCCLSHAQTKAECDFAANLFASLGDYIDAPAMLKACEEKSLELQYQRAVSIMKAAKTEADFNKSAELFALIPTYQEALALREQCLASAAKAKKNAIYSEGNTLFKQRHAKAQERAIALFASVAGYLDANEKRQLCEKKLASIKKRDKITLAITSVSFALIIAIVATISLIFPFETVTRDGVTYQKINGEYHVVGYDGRGGAVEIPSSVRGYPVTAIGNAFRKCEGLTAITIPSSITTIGEDAFFGCTGLEGVYITDLAAWCSIKFGDINASPLYFAKTLYLNGSELSGDVMIPEGVTSIPTCAFFGCDQIKSISLPAGLTSIGDRAFANCTGLSSLTVPESVTSIGLGAFLGCNELQSITLPFVGGARNNAYQSHFGYVFGATTASDNAHFVPSSLGSVTVTDASTVDSLAFCGCASLVSVSLPESVTEIGEGAFSECGALESITLPFVGGGANSNESHFGFVFGTGDHTSNSKHVPATLKNVVILRGDAIAPYAFSGCASIKSITLPASITEIGKDAFAGCTGILRVEDGISYVNKWAVDCHESVTIATLRPDTVGIAAYAFSGLQNLTTITIPANVHSINIGAFEDCAKLTIYAKQIQKPSGWDADWNIDACPVNWGTDTLSTTDGFVWSEQSNGILIQSYTGTATALAIPQTINHRKVVAIAQYAFLNCKELTSLTLPDSIETIGAGAFEGCTKLAAVYISDLAAWCNISFGNANANPLAYATGLYLDGTAITELTLPSNITKINSHAFYHCQSLITVTVPDSVTYIGENAFGGCSNLASMTLPFMGHSRAATTSAHFGYLFGATSYSENGSFVPTALKAVAITGGNSIMANAFSGCSQLQSITVPTTVTSIGRDAFSGCNQLSTLTLPFAGTSASATSTGYLAYLFGARSTSAADDTVPTSLKTVILTSATTIGSNAFNGCNSITSIILPDGLLTIGDSAFRMCTRLEAINLPASVTSIGSGAFYSCSSLLSITIPANVTYIGPHAFAYSKKLQAVYFEQSSKLMEIDYSAFSHCTKLSSINLQDCDRLTDIGSGIFNSCENLTSLTLPASVSFIDVRAFAECPNLTSISVEKGGTYHSEGNCLIKTATKTLVFGCQSSVIPDDGSVTVIDEYAFDGCASLKSIVIPKSVTRIERYAFANCAGLSTVVFGHTTGWTYMTSTTSTPAAIASTALEDTYNAADLLGTFYSSYLWLHE